MSRGENNLESRVLNVVNKIDHAVLKPTQGKKDVNDALDLMLEYPIASLCIHSGWLKYIADEYKNQINIGTVIGFPLGAVDTSVKVAEAVYCANNGAKEIDVVMNIGMVKSKLYTKAKKDLTEVIGGFSGTAQLNGMQDGLIGGAYIKNDGSRVVKVILETCYLTHDEKVAAVKLAVDAGATYVKTSTGFGDYGATIEDVELLRELTPDNVGVKASGGIKTLEDAEAMIQAGAARLGTSSTLSIIEKSPIQ